MGSVTRGTWPHFHSRRWSLEQYIFGPSRFTDKIIHNESFSRTRKKWKHWFLSARRTHLHDINTVPLPCETPRTRKLFNRLPSRTIYANNTDVPCSESPCNYAPDDVTGYFTGLLFLKFFWGDISFLRGHWYPWFGILVTSTLDFKARGTCRLCALFPACNRILGLTSDATPDDLLVANLAAELFYRISWFIRTMYEISCFYRIFMGRHKKTGLWLKILNFIRFRGNLPCWPSTDR